MSKKRDSKPLYVPPRPSPARTKDRKPQPTGVQSSDKDVIDGLAALSIKSVKEKKVAKRKSNEKPTGDEVVDSWEDILDGVDDKLAEQGDNSDDEVVHQDPQFDYLKMPNNHNDSEDEELMGFGHVIEVYDFLPSLRTADIAMPFASFRNDFRMKWVDDTHALGVFSCSSLAKRALSMEFVIFKVRPISEASSQSKAVAMKVGEPLRPVGDRPKTSASTARRMVANALGVRVNISKEQREKERRELQEAKEQKKRERKTKVDLWND